MSNLEPNAFPALDWSEPEAPASLGKLFAYVDAKTLEAINWYLKEKQPKALWSRGLRVAAILLTTAGGLVPLLAGSGIVQPGATVGATTIGISQLGYVFLGLAGAAVAFDKFFGFSSAWMRFISSATRLQGALLAFRFEWSIMEARLRGQRPDAAQVETMLLKIKEFAALLQGEVESETKEWIAEFRTSIAEVERAAKAQQEALQMGGLALTVPNGRLAPEGFTVALDGSPVGVVRGTSWQMAYVAPGMHHVRISAQIGPEAIEASEMVMVQPGTIAKFTLELPVSATL